MTTSELSKDIHGWLVIDKPVGIGSTTVVSMIRRITGIKKIGHGGTLAVSYTHLTLPTKRIV